MFSGSIRVITTLCLFMHCVDKVICNALLLLLDNSCQFETLQRMVCIL